MSKLADAVRQYFDETDKNTLAEDLAELEKYNQDGPLVDVRMGQYSQQRIDAYDYLLKCADHADKLGCYIMLVGHFGCVKHNILVIRLSPKGECKDEVRDLEVLCDDMVWYDDVLRSVDIFPTMTLVSMSINVTHGNYSYREYNTEKK